MREEAVRILIVSIHAPARGATRCAASRWHPLGRFNPRARTGRDAWAARPYFESAVSIHAPARGATTRAQSSRDEFKVSIHAPARGATSTAMRSPGCTTSFNPRARTGRDHCAALPRWLSHVFQSTRPHGARLEDIGPPVIAGAVSIHAPARGATTDTCNYVFYKQFQSTRPHGARRSMSLDPSSAVAVSIHAPARGATGYL